MALPFRELWFDHERGCASLAGRMPALHMDQRIVIVGFMGSGKTTVAKALATRLGCGLADLDAIVSAQQNMSVPELINEQGESSFRDAETSALQVVLDRQAPRIIALGGGAWTLERNRELINKHGCVTVWLDAPYDLCWQRITDHPAPRPLALDEEKARELYHARRPLYALARLRVPITDKMSPDDVAAGITSAIERRVTAH